MSVSIRTERASSAAPEQPLKHASAFCIALGLVVVLRWAPCLVHQRELGDESYYMTIATEMLHGARLYHDVVDRKPPLLYYTHWLALEIVGEYNFRGLHALALGWLLCTMAVLGAAATATHGPRAGLAAAGLYGLNLPSYDYHDFSLNGELLMNLPISGAFAIAIWPTRSRARPMLFGAGFLLAIAVLLKQSALMAVPVLVLYPLHSEYRARRALEIGHSVFHATLMLGGFALGLGAFALFLHEQGILGEAIAWTFWNNDVTYRPTDQGFWLLCVRAFALFGLASSALIALSVLGLRDAEPDAQCPRDAASAQPKRLLLALLAASAVGAAIPGRFFSHYLFQLLPPMVLLAAPIAARLALAESAQEVATRRRLFAILAGTTVVLFCLHSVGLALRRGPGPASLWLRRNTATTDRIFAWTVSPDVYLDARRRPASRFIGSYPLNGMQFGSLRRFDPTFDTSERIVPGAWTALREEFEHSPPPFIVDGYSRMEVPVYTPKHYAVLSRLLARDYEVAFDGADAIVYRRVKKAPWPQRDHWD